VVVRRSSPCAARSARVTGRRDGAVPDFADPATLGNDFGLFGVALWPELLARYPTHAKGWNQKLVALNVARNGIAHDDGAKITRVQADGWPLTLRSVDRWKSSLDGLARGMDRVVAGHLKLMYGTTPW
jgi:hypothetical protein